MTVTSAYRSDDRAVTVRGDLAIGSIEQAPRSNQLRHVAMGSSWFHDTAVAAFAGTAANSCKTAGEMHHYGSKQPAKRPLENPM
jgi:hypothetical protein